MKAQLRRDVRRSDTPDVDEEAVGDKATDMC